jgi:hypothetical protein
VKDKEIPLPESMPRLTRNCDSVMKGTASLLGHPSYGSLDVDASGLLRFGSPLRVTLARRSQPAICPLKLICDSHEAISDATPANGREVHSKTSAAGPNLAGLSWGTRPTPPAGTATKSALACLAEHRGGLRVRHKKLCPNTDP